MIEVPSIPGAQSSFSGPASKWQQIGKSNPEGVKCLRTRRGDAGRSERRRLGWGVRRLGQQDGQAGQIRHEGGCGDVHGESDCRNAAKARPSADTIS